MIRRLFSRLADRLIARAQRTPYQHLPGYMERFWLLPYSRWRPFAARVHHILRSDDDRAFHDHPWPYLTIVLRGGYTEVRPLFSDSGIYIGTTSRWHGPGSILFRRAKSWHRLELPAGETAWTLFVSGPKSQSWGFMPAPDLNKIYWRRYLNDYDTTGTSDD
jgi:hypothetical protein